MSRFRALFTAGALAVCLFPGCGKAQTPESAAGSKASGFSPSPPEQNSTATKADPVSESFDKAAAQFALFNQSSPGERSAILREGLPLLDAALKASDERLLRDAKAVDFRTIAKLDGRFAEAWVWRDFRSVAKGSSQAKSGPLPLNATVVYTNVGGHSPAPAPVAEKDSPAQAGQFSAKGVGTVVAIGAELTKKTYDDLAFMNEVAALLEAAMKRKDYDEILKLKANDSLEEQEKKIIVKAALDAFLGSVVSYKGSYFLAAERVSGLMEVWEFKHRIGVKVSRVPVDVKTRLNTGVELVTKVEFSHDETSDLCRRYMGGYWGTWGEFPKIGEIEITRDENWSVEFKSELPFRSFHRLSLVEIDLALSKSGTTKVIAAAEKKAQDDQESPEAKVTLLGFYAAQENYEKAHAIASGLLEAESLELPVAKRVATALFGEVVFSRPAMGETVRSGIGFKYYDSLKGLNPEIGEMQQLPYPRRLQKGYFYGTSFDLNDCIKAFELLSKADPSDADALFDLSILEVFGTHRFRKPLETDNDRREKEAVAHLTKAVAVASKSPPKSGRNFSKLITEEPTFIVLSGQETFEALLGRLFGGDAKRAPEIYGRKFQRQCDYLNAGY